MDLTYAEPLRSFANEIGGVDEGPVSCVGGRTQWDVCRSEAADAREVRAPAGIVEFEPAEMVVRVRAGTPVGDLAAALASKGQQVPLDPRQPEATVGGVLAVGHSGIRRLRYGPIRDTVLEAIAVTADGKLVKTGGPVVKNVSGYDLGRLLVGSLGTLGFLAELVLRCQPLPRVTAWFRSPPGADPFAARDRLFRPSSILWDGQSVWVLLEGHEADVAAEATALGGDWTEVASGPAIPDRGRESLRATQLRDLRQRHAPGFLAEVGIGTVHLADAADVVLPDAAVADAVNDDLQRRVKAAFDPTGRMNPGRMFR